MSEASTGSSALKLLKEFWGVAAAVLAVIAYLVIQILRLDVQHDVLVALLAVPCLLLWIAWRYWPPGRIAKIAASILIVVLSVALGYLVVQSSRPAFEITALDALEGDRNAYEVTDMLIWNQSTPEEYGVSITFTLEIRPTYFGNRKLGEVVARITGEGGALPDRTLWDDFSSDSGTTKVYLSLPEILQASGVGLNSEPSHNPFGPGDLPFEEASLTIQVAKAADLTHPWASEEIIIRNAPWELRSERIWRNENHEVDVFVKNLGGTGEFTVRYHLVRPEKDIGADPYPMVSGVTTVDVWNAPDEPVRLEKGEFFTDTVPLPTELPRGRYLLEVYAVKKQNYVQFKDPNTTWEDLDTLESPWWFGRFPADIHILVETSSIPVDETIEAEWKRLRDEEGIDLGISLAPAEVVISVDEEGNPKTEGLRQVFQEGEIYQHDGEAYALYGPILRKYKQWGGLGSYMLGFPISPIQPVTSSLGTEGMMVQLEGHSDWPPPAIYSSTKSIAATWPWIGAVYSEDLGGHTGWLGFPLTDEQDYEDSTLQMFERGYIVYYIPRVGEDRDWTRTPVAYPYLTSLGSFLDVYAQQWQDTGIQVEEGDRVSIIQVDGTWTNGGPTQNWFDANGNPDEEPQEDALLPSAPIGALIGKVGQDGPAFLVGRWAVFPVEAGGTLYLAMNDTSYTTNDGHITVEISVELTE